jgi:hypothetical protein
MRSTSEEYREQAERCRRFARDITSREDPAIAALLKLALEWDAKAVEIEAAPPIAPPSSPAHFGSGTVKTHPIFSRASIFAAAAVQEFENIDLPGLVEEPVAGAQT